MICGVNVLLRTSNVFMAAIKGPMMMVTRCVSIQMFLLCENYCLLLGWISAGTEVLL